MLLFSQRILLSFGELICKAPIDSISVTLVLGAATE